ncbi:MAG: hypothetical protein IJU58_03635 [Clostridia bacterium]|nr:hypothetical protein [Clostridia bacterium]
MNLLQNILGFLGQDNQQNNILSGIAKIFSSNTQPPSQTANTNYYSLPTYNYEQPKTTPSQNLTPTSQNQNNFESIIKIASILLEYLLTKRKNTEKPPTTVEVNNATTTQSNNSQIEKLKRIDKI